MLDRAEVDRGISMMNIGVSGRDGNMEHIREMRDAIVGDGERERKRIG